MGSEVLERKEWQAGFGQTEGVYEIHGNWKLMRCTNEECPSDSHFCSIPMNLPSVNDLTNETFEIPTCPHCGSIMKPHTMLFDEYYEEDHYRLKSVAEAVHKADTLLLVGTAFYTSLSKLIVYRSLYHKLKVIEVNKELQLNTMSWFRDICQLQG